MNREGFCLHGTCILVGKQKINKYRLRSTLLAIVDGLVEDWPERRRVQTVVIIVQGRDGGDQGSSSRD